MTLSTHNSHAGTLLAHTITLRSHTLNPAGTEISSTGCHTHKKFRWDKFRGHTHTQKSCWQGIPEIGAKFRSRRERSRWNFEIPDLSHKLAPFYEKTSGEIILESLPWIMHRQRITRQLSTYLAERKPRSQISYTSRFRIKGIVTYQKVRLCFQAHTDVKGGLTMPLSSVTGPWIEMNN